MGTVLESFDVVWPTQLLLVLMVLISSKTAGAGKAGCETSRLYVCTRIKAKVVVMRKLYECTRFGGGRGLKECGSELYQ